MKTALVIEDNENNLELIRFILNASGYQIICAETGKQGYQMAVQAKPDFILLDIQLPDMEGTQVLTMIRAHADTKTIPVIAVTSYAMTGDRERLLAAGCDGYVEKPIDPDLIVEHIKSIVGE